jgi:hypothetical protein
VVAGERVAGEREHRAVEGVVLDGRVGFFHVLELHERQVRDDAVGRRQRLANFVSAARVVESDLAPDVEVPHVALKDVEWRAHVLGPLLKHYDCGRAGSSFCSSVTSQELQGSTRNASCLNFDLYAGSEKLKVTRLSLVLHSSSPVPPHTILELPVPCA